MMHLRVHRAIVRSGICSGLVALLVYRVFTISYNAVKRPVSSARPFLRDGVSKNFGSPNTLVRGGAFPEPLRQPLPGGAGSGDGREQGLQAIEAMVVSELPRELPGAIGPYQLDGWERFGEGAVEPEREAE